MRGRRISLPAAVMAVIIVLTAVGCSKDSPSSRNDWPTYSYDVQDFSCKRDSLTIRGYIWMPEGVEGKTPVVICSHGLLGHYTDCVQYAEKFASKGIACCCFDFCGGSLASYSDGSYRDMSIFTEEADLKAVLEEIMRQDFTDKDKVILAGGSQGGLVSAMVAADMPDKIRALVLMFPAFNIPSTTSIALNALYPDGGYPESISIMDYTFYKPYYEKLPGYDPYAEIGRFTKEVLILHGNSDLLVPVSFSEKAAETYQHATLKILEGQGHGFKGKGFDKSVEYIDDFIYHIVR